MRALLQFFWLLASARFRRHHNPLWTMQTTKGFEQHELDIINELRLELLAHGMQEGEVNQAVLGAWTPEIQSADDLRGAINKSRGISM